MKPPESGLEGALGEETTRRSDINHETPVTPDDDPNFTPATPATPATPESGEGPPPGTDPESEPEPEKVVDYKAAAEEAVGIIDFVAQLGIPFGTRLVNFSREEWRMIKEIKRRKARGLVSSDGLSIPYELTVPEKELMERYHEYRDAMDCIPLEEEERQRIVEPMARVLEKYKKDVGPEGLLIAALISVYGPRMLPMAQPLIS